MMIAQMNACTLGKRGRKERKARVSAILNKSDGENLRKKEQKCVKGRGTPTNLSKTCGEVDTRESNRNVELQPIEEECEHNGSRKPSMAESEHCNNPNKSGSNEETK
jgi:hypothetical protein